MSGQQAPSTVTFHLSPNLLWEDGHWRCECEYAAGTWTITLYFEDVVMAQRSDSRLLSVLRSGDDWRISVTRSQAVLQPKAQTPGTNRRLNAPERRQVPRGGRRSRDPRH